MEIVEIEQNTKEWEEWRRNKIGASDAPIICGVSPFMKPQALWEQKITGKSFKQTKSMQKGHDLEDSIRLRVNEYLGRDYEPLCVQDTMNEWMIASLDGYDRRTEKLLEIKTTNPENFANIQNGCIPKYYIYQIQHQLFVTNLHEATLVVFCEDELLYHTVHRDEAIISEILAKEEAFYRSLVTFEPIEEPLEEVKDQDMLEAVEAWKIAKQSLEECEEILKICRDSILYLGKERNFMCDGVTVKKRIVQGRVDYKKVPELKGVNLDKYRTESREEWRIS